MLGYLSGENLILFDNHSVYYSRVSIVLRKVLKLCTWMVGDD